MKEPSLTQKRQIPITDLGQEYLDIKSELDQVLPSIFRSGAYILGREVDAFEKELAAYVRVSEAIGVNSGTDAITLALAGLGIGKGDEVIVPSMSFFATVEPILHIGAIPIFADIGEQDYNLDPEAVLAAITPKTRAIIAVHLYGLPADMTILAALAKDRGLRLIEDMAQAIGSTCSGRKIGSWGEAACVSFYPTKNLGACGDGGAVLTSNPELASRIRMLRNHGARVKYQHEEIGYNSRLDEIQAAILRLKLKRLESWNTKRRDLAAQYRAGLQGLPIILPTELPGRRHIYHLYSIQSEKRDALRDYLQQEGIATGLHYPIPLHHLPALKQLDQARSRFPVGEQLAARTLSLPLYPFMSSDDVLYVCEKIRKFFQSHAEI